MKTKIIGWNPINNGTGVLKASLYIKPTLDIVRFFNRAVFHRGVVRISDSNSCYDGPNRFATIDKSSDIPNCRNNFYNATGLYVLTLDTEWQGYPLKNGEVHFNEGVVNQIIKYVNPELNSVSTVIPQDEIKVPATTEPVKVPPKDDQNKDVVEKYTPETVTNSLDTSSLLLAGLVILFFLCNAMALRK